MKKYLIGIISIGLIIGLVITGSILQVKKTNSKVFEESGYVLQSKTEQKNQEVERHYFAANEVYKKEYNEKVSFQNTSGEKVSVEKQNFLHYTNGSISSLTKGVIMDFSNINEDPIPYYNIQENMMLKKSGDKYIIKHLNRNLEFNNFIWKIAKNKYIIGSEKLQIQFPDSTSKEINGYVEIEYIDNEVIKIYNQELTYQMVSSNLYILLPDEIKINLSNKIVSQHNENKMSLENMIIDANDNVEIIDIEDEKYKEIVEEEKEEKNEEEKNEKNEKNEINEINKNNQNETNNQNNMSNQNEEKTENNSNKPNEETKPNDTINPNNPDNPNGGSIQIEDNIKPEEPEKEDVLEEKPEIIAPTFKVEELTVDSIGMTAKITIEDEDATLTGDPIIKIVKNDTGKTVYEREESSGVYTIDLNVSSLTPDTEYTLILQANYKVEEVEYTKNFIYKIFRTKSAGIDFYKDYFTNNTLAFNVKIEEDSKIKEAEIVLVNKEGKIEQTKKINTGIIENIEFNGLASNTEYDIEIINILYDGQVISNGFELKKTFKTLKERPELGTANFTIDKRNSEFKISVNNVKDINDGIINCRYEIYDSRIEDENAEPVLTIRTNKNEQATVPVDGIKIERGVPYYFKLVVDFYDNEKEMEFESGYSDIMKMDGVEFPTIRFEEEVVTFERIEGMIIIEDDYNTINLKNNDITITYTDSVGVTKKLTSTGNLKIPVNINDLRANETYKFSVYTTIDLQDGNKPIENCYIGGVVVKTKIPQNLKANFKEDKQDTKNTFKLNFRLENDKETVGTLEAETLSGMTFSIYAGQTTEGTPIKTMKVVDTDLAPYTSVLKEDYYDKSVEITPSFFGANNKDFKDKYYTIAVTKAYDYTQYQNKIPIVKNEYTVETKGYRPDMPVDTENALDVSAIRNRDKDKRPELEASTIVGYEVKAKYNNSELYAKKIIYKAYNAELNELIETKEYEIGKEGIIPTAEFSVEDGTHISIKDKDKLRRGNRYYFTYEVYLDLNKDGIPETKYPYEEEKIELKSQIVIPIKEEAKIDMYPTTSTNDTITYKYKVKDIDNSLESPNITATVNEIIKDKQPIVIDGTDIYKEMTFKNINEGIFSLKVSQRLNKSEFATKKQITEYYYEGKINLNEVKYNVAINSNRIVITLLNVDKKINNIASVTVEIVSDTKTYQKEFLHPENNIIIINLNELTDFLNKRIKVNLYAYYDTGLIGFEQNSEYKLIQQANKNKEENNYYRLNKENNLVPVPTASQNMYNVSVEGTQMKIINPQNKVTSNIDLIKIIGGLTYEYNLINLKQVEKVKLNNDGTNDVMIDLIIPGISLKDSTGKLNIQSEIDNIKFKATIISHEQVKIENDLIYIDIYKTDENGNNEKFIKTEKRTIQDFNNHITINELEPKQYYLMKFRAKIITKNENVEEKYLYDIDYQVLGKAYYFSTLANVGISEVNVKYNPTSYNQKAIDITYKLDRIFGYKKIIYKIDKLNEETQNYENVINNMEDILFKKEMLKQIPCNPGSIFEFGKNYKLTIMPLAIIEQMDGGIKEIELGTVEHEFKLPELRRPLIGISETRPSNDKLNYKITIYDEDRIVENDKYKIRILNNRQEDITPEQYKNKMFSTNLLNNIIKLDGIDKSKEYSIEVITMLDYNNDKKQLKENKKTHITYPINTSGISIGNVSTTKNNIQKNKIDLIFNNSYNLTKIDQIRYSIYNINGYAINDTQAFVPVQSTIAGENIYTFTIEQNLKEEGRYYIELQFLQEGEIVEACSIEHTYIEE